MSGAVTANRHSHGDCQHPACIMLLGYHWADVLPPAAPYRAPTTLLPQTACRCITGLSLSTRSAARRRPAFRLVDLACATGVSPVSVLTASAAAVALWSSG